MSIKRPFDLAKCARPNILGLNTYTTTRFDYPDDAGILYLDANENAFGSCIERDKGASTSKQGITIQSTLDPDALQLHRYPEPQQKNLKQLFCNFRNTGKDAASNPLTPENICLGVGSDESIDIIIRAFCTPGKDKLMICPPSYSAYDFSAAVNDVEIVRVNVDEENHFGLFPKAIDETLAKDPSIKVIFICSPGNPTANVIPRSDIQRILEHPTWNGVVVLDEAYIDFAPVPSMAWEVNNWPNLIVTHTLSKAFGLAGIRLGIAYSSAPITRLMNGLKGPYNMSAPTVALATAALQPEGIELMKAYTAKMVQQRDRLIKELPKIPGFGMFLGGTSANFLLAQFLNKPAEKGGVPDNATATTLQHALTRNAKVLVRFRGNEYGCEGSIRITVGTKEQVDHLLFSMRKTLQEIYDGKIPLESDV